MSHDVLTAPTMTSFERQLAPENEMEKQQLDMIARAINAILAEAGAQLRPLGNLIYSDYAHSSD